MKRKRRKLRVDRIIICLVALVLLFLLIKFAIYTIRNIIIYNRAKSSDNITVYNSELNIWDKTYNYIKENKENVTITYKSNSVTIKTSDLKQGMNIKLNTYDEVIDEPLFNKVDAYYIKSNDILNLSSKIKIRLPGYLLDHEIVDIYKVKNGKIQMYQPAVSIKDKSITFSVEKDTDYFVTYIPVKSISATAIRVNENESKNLKLSFTPSNATNVNVSYKIEDEDIISIKGSIVTGKKAGNTIINVRSDADNVTKEVKVTVNKAEVIEEPKEELVEVKEVNNGTLEIKDGIAYIDGFMLINKSYPLPSTYDPGGLTDEFTEAFDEMQADALKDGIELFIVSGYRSFDYQYSLYEKYVSIDGVELTDTYSARPGHSEHQSGYAADINSADESFEGTPEAIWLDENCYKYGFIVRYPKGKEEYTGYEYEPWHLRYLGKEKAKKIYESGLSIEEYYGLESKYID